MKKIGAVIVIICVILASLLLPAFIIELVVDDGDVGISPVKYEFPFKLVYEIDGETVVVEDTYICKYKGTRWNWNIGRYPKWKTYIKGTGESEVFVKRDGDYNLTISVGSVYEYLNNPSESVTAKAYKEHIYNTGGADLLSAEELLENYNMRIISFEYQSSNY